MNTILIATIGLLFTLVNASAINEALLMDAKNAGSFIYVTCILTPPATASQYTACVNAYATYMAKSQALNTPIPMIISKEPSPYAWSPFDICRYEVDNLIFGKQSEVPYCPAVPK